MLTTSRHRGSVILLLSATLAACARARTLPAGCESVLLGAPSASVLRLADSTPPRLSVATLTPFPEHQTLSSVEVSLYADTIDARATSPLRTGSSDAKGHLALEPLPAGRYGLRARRPGTQPFFSIVRLRAAPSDSLEVRLVTDSQICY